MFDLKEIKRLASEYEETQKQKLDLILTKLDLILDRLKVN